MVPIMQSSVIDRFLRYNLHKFNRGLATEPVFIGPTWYQQVKGKMEGEVRSSKPRDFCEKPKAQSKDQLKPREVFMQKSVRVGVLGGDSYMGNCLAMLLKQNPLVSHIYLHGTHNSPGWALDIRHIDTSTRITAVQTDEEVEKALRCCDIVVMTNAKRTDKSVVSSIPDRMAAELPRIVKLASMCCTVVPKAMLIVAVCPVSITLPIVSDIYRKTHWYHPGRVLGSVALQQLRANSILAEFNDLDPDSVHVPLVGGPEPDNMVPLFSRARPIGVTMQHAKRLIMKFRHINEVFQKVELTCETQLECAPLAEAFGLSRMVTAMALGICGDRESCISAFVRSKVLAACSYLTSTVRFGHYGMNHNYGLPRLTPLELLLLEQGTLLLRKREAMAKYYIQVAKKGHIKMEMPNFDKDMESWLEDGRQERCLVL